MMKLLSEGNRIGALNEATKSVDKTIEELSEKQAEAIILENIFHNILNNTIDEKQKEIEKIDLEIKKLNDLKDKYWNDNSQIQEEIEKKQEEIDNIQNKN